MKFAEIIVTIFFLSGITFSTQHEVTNTAVESPQVDRPVDPNGKHCDWPEVWWPTPRPGRCDCFNRDLKKDCTYPANWVPYSPNVKKSCLCNCPWWAHLVCADNQYLDRGDCKCKCRDPCQDEDCTRPQVWNNHTCQCECQYPVGCVEPRYYNHWTCNCECIQKPRLCCPRLTPLKIWNERKCNCVCARIKSCATWLGYYWDEFICKCVRRIDIWWDRDYSSADYKRMEGGIDNNEGVISDDMIADIDKIDPEATAESCPFGPPQFDRDH